MLYRMVSEGWRDPFNKTRELTMPAFGDQLSPEQIREVVTYLKTLWTSEQRQFQWEETLVRGAFPPQQPASLDHPDDGPNADGRPSLARVNGSIHCHYRCLGTLLAPPDSYQPTSPGGLRER